MHIHHILTTTPVEMTKRESMSMFQKLSKNDNQYNKEDGIFISLTQRADTMPAHGCSLCI